MEPSTSPRVRSRSPRAAYEASWCLTRPPPSRVKSFVLFWPATAGARSMKRTRHVATDNHLCPHNRLVLVAGGIIRAAWKTRQKIMAMRSTEKTADSKAMTERPKTKWIFYDFTTLVPSRSPPTQLHQVGCSQSHGRRAPVPLPAPSRRWARRWRPRAPRRPPA